MKKIFLKLTLVLLITALMMTFVGCADMGGVNDAISGIKDKVVDAFKPYLPACEHVGGTATCTEKAVCDKCGEAYGEALGHDIVIDAAVAPDCTNTGLAEGEHCTRCDYKVAQETVEALGHNAVVDAAVPATCYSTGLTEGKHCDRCGEVLVAQTTTTMIPHTYDEEGFDETCNAEGCTHVRTCAHEGENITVKGFAANCTTAGLTDGEKCAICGDVTKAQEEIPALEHDMADATCTAPAYCKREGCTHTVGTSKGHSYDEGVVTTAPGCETKGVKTYTCTAEGCGHSYEEDVAATGHDYDDTVVPSTCIAQGYTEHVCGNCGDTYRDNEQPLADHTHVGVETTAPTCEGTGLMTYTCSFPGCGDTYTKEIPATGHTEIEHEAQAPGCTTPGWKAYVTCENCDYTTYEEIEPAGHSGGKATCKEPAVCDACGKSYGMPDTEKGHNYGEADCDSPATCKLCGKTSGTAIGHADDDKNHKCDRCDAPQGTHEDTNKDHACDYGCKDAIGTCEDKNLDHACDYGCGEKYGEHIDANKDHVCDYGCSVAMGDHADSLDNDHNCDYCEKFVEGEVCVDENKNHKCDECYGPMGEHTDKNGDGDHLCDYCNGAVEGATCNGGTATCTSKAVCAECGKEYGEKLAHSYGNKEVVDKALKLEATCTTSAVYYYSCSCGDVDRSEGAKTFESGEPKAHPYETVVTGPTCTAEGYTTYTCPVCKDSKVDDRVPSKGHSYDVEVVAPTCTAGGYTKHTCSVCGDSYTDATTPAKDHAWNAGEVTKAPTCTDKGVKTFTCGACNETKTEEIEANGHNHVAGEPVAPTCTEAGYTTYTCACGDSYVDDETEPQDHSWNEGEVTTAPTCLAKGVKVYTCGACGETKEETLATVSHEFSGDADLDCNTCGGQFRLFNGGFESGMEGWTLVGNIGGISSDRNYWVGDPESAEGFAFGMDGDKMFSAYAPGAEERLVGTLTSSTFKIGGSGFVTFKVGAMRDENYVYIDVVDANTKEILARYYNGLWAERTDDKKSGCTLIAYKADLSAFMGKEVFFRISDNADSGYGLFFVDSFVTYYENEPEGFNKAKPVSYTVTGTIYDLFNGGFEMGDVQGWWSVGEIGLVTNANGYWGDNIPYEKVGDYLFTGVESNGADTMREGNRGTLTSSVFEIGGTGWISFKLGGGGNEFCYVQVIDAVTGEILARYHQQAQRDAILIQYVADLSAYIGRTARIQVVDYASSGWGCVSFDNVVTYYPEGKALPEGAITANNIFHGVYSVNNGSFENGLDGWHMNIWEAGAHNTLGWVESSEHDAGWYTKNDGRKDGNNLFTFCRPDGTNCENTKGELVSSTFTLKQGTFVSFRFGGAGTRAVRVELVRADGTVIATFYNEAPGKINTEMFAYYYQYNGETADCFFRVVDDSVSNYGCFVVDDFRVNLESAPEGFIPAIQ